MANNPHDKSGKKCSNPKCKAVFTKNSLTLTIPRRVGAMIIHETVCPACHNAHYSGGKE